MNVCHTWVFTINQNSNGLYNTNPNESNNNFFIYKAVNRSENEKKIVIQANGSYADIVAIVLGRKEIYFFKAECNADKEFISYTMVNAFNGKDKSSLCENKDGKIKISLAAWENTAFVIKCNVNTS